MAISPISNCCRNQYSRKQVPQLESWRTQVYFTSGPRGVNTPGSEPRTEGWEFYTRIGMIKWFVGLQELGNCKEQEEGEWDKLQFPVMWVPTFWDLCDPDFARSKLGYRGRRSRLFTILNFPLHYQEDSAPFPLSSQLRDIISHREVGHHLFPLALSCRG